jgi:GntR family transcriptional regulator
MTRLRDQTLAVSDDVASLDRHTSATVHQQLAELLKAHVAELSPGDQLPTEHELATSYEVSRTTVRRAMRSLVDEGLLIRQQGKGTFVAPQRVVHPLDRLRPFVSMFTAAGIRPTGQVLAYQYVAPPDIPASLPAMDAGALLVRRLYLLADAPQAVAEIYVPDPLGQQISRAEIGEHPIYQVLQDRLGVTLDRAAVTLRSVAAHGDLAAQLRLEPGSPLLVMQRATYNDQERLVECALYYLPAAKFELQLTVPAQQPQPVSYSFTHPGANLVLINGGDGPRSADDDHAAHGASSAGGS